MLDVSVQCLNQFTDRSFNFFPCSVAFSMPAKEVGEYSPSVKEKSPEIWSGFGQLEVNL